MEAARIEAAAAVNPAPHEDGLFRNGLGRQAEFTERLVNQLPNVVGELIVRHSG